MWHRIELLALRLSVKCRDAYEHRMEPALRLIYSPFLLFALLFSIICLFWVPSAGIAIGALGAAGVFVAIKGEKLHPSHKVLWAFITLLLLVTEVRAIKKQDEEHAAKLKEILDETTGGDSFPEITAYRTETGELQFTIVSVGKNNLTDLRITMRPHVQRYHPHGPPADWPALINVSIPIATTSVLNLDFPDKVSVEGELDRYVIDINARNGVFREELEIRKLGPPQFHVDFEIYDMPSRKVRFKSPGYDSSF
jgi:hypothetical protein